jgi:hypothetical protein
MLWRKECISVMVFISQKIYRHKMQQGIVSKNNLGSVESRGRSCRIDREDPKRILTVAEVRSHATALPSCFPPGLLCHAIEAATLPLLTELSRASSCSRLSDLILSCCISQFDALPTVMAPSPTPLVLRSSGPDCGATRMVI